MILSFRKMNPDRPKDLIGGQCQLSRLARVPDIPDRDGLKLSAKKEYLGLLCDSPSLSVFTWRHACLKA